MFFISSFSNKIKEHENDKMFLDKLSTDEMLLVLKFEERLKLKKY